MRLSIGSLLATAAFAFTPLVHAQEPAPPPTDSPVQQPGEVDAEPITDEELETFADIYIELEDTLHRFEEELAAAQSDEEAQTLQVQMQEESFEKISDHGWSLTEYNRVVQAVNSNPELLQKAVALIEDRRS